MRLIKKLAIGFGLFWIFPTLILLAIAHHGGVQ